MLFEAQGWNLPSSIKPQANEKQKQSQDGDASNRAEEQKRATKEADRLQLQITQIEREASGSTANTKNVKKKQQQQPKRQPEDTLLSPAHKKTRKNRGDSKTDGDQNQLVRNDEKETGQQQGKKQKQKQLQEQQQQKKQQQKKQQQQQQQQKQVQQQAQPKEPETEQKINKDKKTTKQILKKKLQEMLKEKSAVSSPQVEPCNKPTSNKKDEPRKNNPASSTKLTPLQQKMKEKLTGARFRWLNEQLYTAPGDISFKLFQEKPELFDEYHSGFRHQVESWPENPVDIFVSQLSKLPEGTVIADLGCGDAKIAHTLKKQKVLSFDMVAKNDKVIPCDISKLPLPDNSVDVAVFSLALMGTNYVDFLKEAKRVLKPGGDLKIAEVVSRFSDIDGFIDMLEELGFEFLEKDTGNKMFVMLYFAKQTADVDQEIDEEMLQGLSKKQKRALKKGAGVQVPTAKFEKKAASLLKPCLYKKR